MPPPIPLVRTASLTLGRAKRDGRSWIVARSVGPRDVLAQHSKDSGVKHDAVWMPEDQIFDVEVQTSGGSALLRFLGSFHRTCGWDEPANTRRIGPLSFAEADEAAAAVREALALPRVPLDVDAATLAAEPARYSRQFVRTLGVWTVGLEQSTFAGAWLRPADAARHLGGPGRMDASAWRVTGWFEAGERGPLQGFGHLGMSRSELLACAMEPSAAVPLADALRELHNNGLAKDLDVAACRRLLADEGAGPETMTRDDALAMLHRHYAGEEDLVSRSEAALADGVFVARQLHDEDEAVVRAAVTALAARHGASELELDDPGDWDAIAEALTAALRRAGHKTEAVLPPLGATHGLVAIRDRVSGGPLRLFAGALDLRSQR
ncbi:hypothetical protein [Nannocystis punicea]|uniref:Uncharacterized protein n=1 Tax=Nannocystis punicea TaxID=2995304 RepID=A0ABY7H106_9BACT|nr:hypothetical protein [Nannocystis poenicansa]WAS92785.1 hypothetical protein O0S08_41955 [Nannocystis poenicansa]